MSTRIGSPSSVAAFAKPACQSFCSVTEVTPDRSSPLTLNMISTVCKTASNSFNS